MTKRKLIIGQNLAGHYVEKIQAAIPDWEIIAGRDSSVWQDELASAEVIAGWRKGMEDALKGDTKLKWLQTWSAGVNSLPLEALEEKNISVTSASGVHANPISETIFALMLALTRKIHTYIRNQQLKTWHNAGLKLEIHHKTVGILGIGAIGKETAKIAKAFGMTVLGMRFSGQPEEYVDKMYTPDHLNSLLPECDYVIDTLPLTRETHHLIGKEQFDLMKKTAFFINIGRGDSVVEEDLISALEQGLIAGAGLDVFETEPLNESSPLWEMENVIITPHTAGATEYYDQRVIDDIFIPNLRQYLQNETPSINSVCYKKGY
ncbi:phosphoglycerate dehydrogenase-like enzyme [Peribacillus deserti]|uniref:Phosphoglycerate dehydrogenase-like enzyme n=1 Tax=Peribacillus deserti TaxID=673318 RepID=A0ABS2QIZ3_9BACI|nr:D-2-hydroxyacid dehydrogenase [Peribacillus deserti]MBM7692774.1 phosphoglycerate dehydrogenase-like enzyme [Peribacillus deserti]